MSGEGIFSWLADHGLLTVCSHGLFLVSGYGERTGQCLLLLQHSSQSEGTTFMFSSNLNYLFKAPWPDIITLRVRAATYTFWRDTIITSKKLTCIDHIKAFLASGLLWRLAHGKHQWEMEGKRKVKSRVIMSWLCPLNQVHSACQAAFCTHLPVSGPRNHATSFHLAPVVARALLLLLVSQDTAPSLHFLHLPCILVHLCKQSLY